MDEQRQDTEPQTRQRRLKDGTIISSPIDAPPHRKKKRFKSQDPARFGCSVLVLIITALVILLHFLGGD
jgi:hypothetical protein